MRVQSLAFAEEEPLSPGAAANPVRVQWLGAAGFRIEFEQHTVLIDPYLTRASWVRCLLGPLRSNPATIARLAGHADAIVVSHTHFDHALDVPAIAVHCGADVWGSASAARLCLTGGVAPDRVHVVQAGSQPTSVRTGPFLIRFVRSAHSALIAGWTPFLGDIQPGDHPTRVEHFRCGAVFILDIEVGGRRLVHMGSAHLVDDTPCGETDLLMLCVAGWKTSRKFPERVARAFAPRAVILSHWDDFFRTLDRPARRLPGTALDKLAGRLRGQTSVTRVGTVALMGAVLI